MLYVSCPHCGGPCEIIEVACGIFRHGVFKNTMIHIPPHSPKEVCEALVQQGQIYGCGKPFRLELRNAEYIAVECDYI